MMIRLFVVATLVGFYAVHPLLGLTALAGVTVVGIKMRRSMPLRAARQR